MPLDVRLSEPTFGETDVWGRNFEAIEFKFSGPGFGSGGEWLMPTEPASALYRGRMGLRIYPNGRPYTFVDVLPNDDLEYNTGFNNPVKSRVDAIEEIASESDSKSYVVGVLGRFIQERNH